MFACHGSPAVFRAFCKMRLCSIRRSPLAAVIYEWGKKKSTPAWPVDVSRGTKLGFAPAIERAYGVYAFHVKQFHVKQRLRTVQSVLLLGPCVPRETKVTRLGLRYQLQPSRTHPFHVEQSPRCRCENNLWSRASEYLIGRKPFHVEHPPEFSA